MSVEASWDKLTEQLRDEKLFGGGYDRPLLELVNASRGTNLRRFFPFTTMNRLCFARTHPWTVEDAQPASIEFWPVGRYQVRAAGPYRDPPVVLDTMDPVAAIEEAVRILSGDTESGGPNLG
jgi:Family of unknown function (DUF6193)